MRRSKKREEVCSSAAKVQDLLAIASHASTPHISANDFLHGSDKNKSLAHLRCISTSDLLN